jgi:hypothetical protein
MKTRWLLISYFAFLSVGWPQSVPDYHSPSEALLSFFPPAIARLEHDGVSADRAKMLMVDAQAQVAAVNRRAANLVQSDLRDEVSRYQQLLADYAQAADRAEKAQSEARRTAVAEHRYDWRATTNTALGMAKTPLEEAAEGRATEASAQVRVIFRDVENSKQELSLKFSSSMQPSENSAYSKVTDQVQSVTNYAESAGVRSTVHVRTTNPGALAHFQTLGQRLRAEPGITAGQTTNDGEQSLPIGMYFVWTERSGRVTSDVNRQVMITEEKVPIDIAEN